MLLPRISPRRQEGQEAFRLGGQPAGVSILDFWRWSVSDLVSNATRGRLAEFIVALALEVPVAGVRDEWASYDLLTPEGIKVEVKASGFLQSWAQKGLSAVSFGIRRTLAWDPETLEWGSEAGFQSDVYVFALLAHRDKESVEPLNLDQWEFYVVPTRILAGMPPQKRISLRSLQRLAGGAVSFAGLRAAVLAAAEPRPKVEGTGI